MLSTLTPLYTLAEMMVALFTMAFVLQWAMSAYQIRRLQWFRDGGRNGKLQGVLDFFLYGNPEVAANGNPYKESASKSGPTARTVLFSFVGLQASYLVWGVMQERLMTTKYDGESFPSSSFLVLSNRVFAIVFAAAAVLILPQPVHRAPFVSYSFAAVANTISSYTQYEALRFVSFPMATVTKACKIIPTMLMGKLVQGKTYSGSDYAYALVITSGVVVFALESAGGVGQLSESAGNLDAATFVPGAILMATYLVVDAFTPNWQNRLFQEYQISPYQSMLGINVFSIGMGLFNLVQTASLGSSFQFLLDHPKALNDIFIMSLSSATGQLFIYYTIQKNGPVVFSVITVTRQLFSIVISSFTFGHLISNVAWAGVLVTFAGILGNTLIGNGRKPAKPSPVSKATVAKPNRQASF
jgi:adenosine 3'-phospho 5'-phosphosulfate transporter B2